MATIRPRKNKNEEIISYEIAVFRDRDENGKRRYWNTTWKPEPGWSKRTVEARLKAFARDFERDCKEGRVLTKEDKELLKQKEIEADAEKITLRTYVETIFLPLKENTCAESTSESYARQAIRILDVLGDKKLGEIKPQDINTFLVWLQTKETAKHRTKTELRDTGRLLSYNTVLRTWALLSTLFATAYKNELIESNPMDRVNRPKPRKDEIKRPVGSLSEAEAIELLECIKTETYQWQCFIRLLLDIGCRRGELVGLLWQYVDFEHNTVTIANCLEYTPRKGVYTTTPKNRQLRTVDVDPEIMEMLRHLPEHQRVPSNDGYVFVGNNGEPVHPNTPTEHFRRFREKFGFDLLTPHTLRHTVATISLEHNADLVNVSQRLGHSRPSVTLDIYAHPNTEGMKRAGDAYRQALRRPPEGGT